MVERRQLTDEHIRLWREGCALLDQMSRREYRDGESERYHQFQDVNKRLTWRLAGSHACSLFSSELDGPPNMGPEYAQTIDWPIAQAWRAALIEATGLTPRDFSRVTELQELKAS
jgi:hypothetical protein